MSKHKAKQALEQRQSQPEDFVITYEPIEFLFDRPQRVYAFSPALSKFFPSPDMPVNQAFFFGDGKITFFHPIAKTYPAKLIEAEWGNQYLVKYSESTLAQAIKNLIGEAKTFIGAIATLILFVITQLGTITAEIAKWFPVKDTPQASPIEQILQETYYALPHPKPNGVFYWRYEQNCTVRTLEAGFSPTLKPGALKGIASRRTDETGWASVYLDHANGNPSRIQRDSLPRNNALYKTMADLNVSEVVSVPVGEGCPIGYISGGFTEQLEDVSYRALVRRLAIAAEKIQKI